MSENYYHHSEYPTSEYTYSEYSSSNNGYQQTTTEYHSSSYYSSSTTNYEGGFETPRPSFHGLGGYGAPDRRENNDDDEELLEQDDDNQLFLKVKPSMADPPKDFKLSTCEGRKRALLIGINYFGTENELNGCINDVHNVKNFLIDLYGFKEEDMVILTDDQQEPKLIPTRANIIAAMQWLVHDADDNDSFFLHYSGHGGSVPDENGDEPDGFDETIYPVDFQEYEGTSGQIIDDDLHEILVKPLPKGCRLTAIFDSCHSGTVLDLPYIYSTKGTLKDQNLFKDAGRGLLEAGIAYATGDREGALESLKELGMQLLTTRRTEEDNKEKYYSPADVIQFSGCKDDQTSADAQEAGKATGAMSYAFITSLRANPNQTYQELLNSVRDILRDKYSQRPQLSSSHPIDTSLQFVC